MKHESATHPLSHTLGVPACGFGEAVICLTVTSNAYADTGRRVTLSRYLLTAQPAYTVGVPEFLMGNGRSLAQNHAPLRSRCTVICDHASQPLPYIRQHRRPATRHT